MTGKLLVLLMFVALAQGQDFFGFVQKWATISAFSKPGNSTGSDGKSPMDIFKISEIQTSVQKVVPQWIPKSGDNGSENSTSDKRNSTSSVNFVKLTEFEDVTKVFSKWVPSFGGQSSDNSTTSDKQNATSPMGNFIKIIKVEDIRETFAKGVPKLADETSDNSTTDKQ